MALVALVLAAAALSWPPAILSVASAEPVGPAGPSIAASGHAAPPFEWTVNGTVRTHSGLPLAGANVTVVDAPCPVLPDPNDDGRCRYVASGTTGPDGNFSVPIPSVPSSYWVYSRPADGFGGDYEYLGAVHGSVGGLAMSVWPYRPYGNATIVLPGYDDLSSYACNGQGQGECGTSVQVPILSWSADGATYVNASDDLVFDPFSNGTVRSISSAWTPLYQDFMNYGGVENTEWATADGSYVYTLGCPSDCQTIDDLELEAVNVSTGALVTHTWNATVGSVHENGQENLIGLNGSDDVAALINESGGVHLFGLANGTEWVGGQLAFFEANNVYWVPQLNSYIDIQAGGSASDHVVQYRFNGAGLRPVYSGTWGTGVVSDLVNGLVYNLTDHQIDFEAGAYSKDLLVTDALAVGPKGTIVGSRQIGTFGDPSWPARKWTGVAPSSSEHRIVATAGGPTVAADFTPLFDNSSWLQDPSTQTWFDTNQSMDDGSSQAGNAPQGVEGLFDNGSYAIDPASLYCAGSGNKNWSPNVCPLEGTLPNTTVGTIWWFWQIGEPQFPFPSDSPIAEPLPPAAPAVRIASIGATTLTVNWTGPAASEGPIANWTVFWGTSPGNYTNSTSVLPGARSAVVGGLVSGVTYYIGVRALNLHWFGPMGTANGTPLGPPASPVVAPSDLAIGPLVREPQLAWTNPPVPLNRTTVYWGPSCSELTGSVNLPTLATSFVVPEVPNGTAEFFAVADWSPAGRSALSNCVGDTPPAPRIVYATNVNATKVEIYIAENVSPVFNVSVRYGPTSCDSFPDERDSGKGGPWVDESGLNASQSYCFEAAVWSYGGESPWSSPVLASTFGPIPAPPDGVTATPNALGQVVVGWDNPAGPLLNDTVLWGSSCTTMGHVASTGGPSTSWTVASVPNGTTDWFGVIAWGPDGPSVPSECVSDGPATPSIVSASPEGPGAVEIVVSDLGQASVNHTVAYGRAPCGAPSAFQSAGGPSDRFALVGLLPSTRYCLEVALWTVAGRSPYSASVNATTLPPAPSAATGLAVVSVATGSVTLSWNDPASPITNATLEVGRGCDELAPWQNETPTTERATVTGLSASTTYCFSLRVWNGSRGSPAAVSVEATTPAFRGSAAVPPPSPPSSEIPPVLIAGAVGLLALVLLLPWLGRRLRPPPARRRPHQRTTPDRPRASAHPDRG